MNISLNDINIKLSIVIPTFNTENYINETLQSLLNINKERTEIIIIDDCSSDQTVAIAKNWLDKNHILNQIAINEENRGPSYSRNRGIELAKGKYITFFDSDDICVSSCYDKALQAMENHNIELCIFGAKSFDHKTQDVYEFPDNAIWKEILKDDDYKITTLSREPLISGLAPNMMNKIYKTDTIRKNDINFPQGFIFEDLYFYAKSMLSIKKILLINEDILLYRVNRGGQLTSLNNAKYNDIINISSKIVELDGIERISEKAWSNLIGSAIRLNVWCSENCHYNEKSSFVEKSIEIFGSLPGRVLETYKNSNPLTLWEKNIITCYQDKNKQVLEVVAEGGYPDLPSNNSAESEQDTKILFELRDMLNSLISQQRDGWANDRFNVLNEKIETIKTSIIHYEGLFKTNNNTNNYTLEKIEEILLSLHHESQDKDTDGNSLLYEKIIKSVNDIKNKLK